MGFRLKRRVCENRAHAKRAAIGFGNQQIVFADIANARKPRDGFMREFAGTGRRIKVSALPLFFSDCEQDGYA